MNKITQLYNKWEEKHLENYINKITKDSETINDKLRALTTERYKQVMYSNFFAGLNVLEAGFPLIAGVSYDLYTGVDNVGYGTLFGILGFGLATMIILSKNNIDGKKNETIQYKINELRGEKNKMNRYINYHNKISKLKSKELEKELEKVEKTLDTYTKIEELLFDGGKSLNAFLFSSGVGIGASATDAIINNSLENTGKTLITAFGLTLAGLAGLTVYSVYKVTDYTNKKEILKKRMKYERS